MHSKLNQLVNAMGTRAGKEYFPFTVASKFRFPAHWLGGHEVHVSIPDALWLCLAWEVNPLIQCLESVNSTLVNAENLSTWCLGFYELSFWTDGEQYLPWRVCLPHKHMPWNTLLVAWRMQWQLGTLKTHILGLFPTLPIFVGWLLVFHLENGNNNHTFTCV